MRAIFVTLIGFFVTLGAEVTIPVVDMRDFEKNREEFVAQVGEALREVGFFAVINPEIDFELLDRGYDAAKAFFKLQLEEKRKIQNLENGGQRGYVESESAKGQSFKDCKEFLHIGPELSDKELKQLGYAKNIWPESMDLKGPMVDLYRSLEKASINLQKGISLALGQDEDFVGEMTSNGDTLLRPIHYPSNPPANRIWAAAHTDIDFFTILPRATAQGLQVKTKDGEWLTVKVPENAFIVNAGDMLCHISNGEFRRAEHRVVALGEDYERYSMVMFVHPRSDCDLTPRPENIARTGGVQKYSSCQEWELLWERLADLGLAPPYWLERLGQSGFLERQIEMGHQSPDAMLAVYEAGFASAEVEQALIDGGHLGGHLQTSEE